MSVGFKEWAIVCAALGQGTQSLILRKGGIHEGRDGFRFKHAEFFLFPTLFHEQVAKTTLPAGTLMPPASPGVIEIEYFARTEWTAPIIDWEKARALGRFHIWNEAEIKSRFHYENAGLNLAFVRIFRLRNVWRFPDAPKFGGCRSWVDLPEIPEGSDFTSVIDNAAHEQRARELRGILGS